jgi:hypothetical protein
MVKKTFFEMKETNNIQLSKIVKPKTLISNSELKTYFAEIGCEKERDNVIKGFAWHLWLTDNDFLIYTKSLRPDLERISLKKQIKKLIKYQKYD